MDKEVQQILDGMDRSTPAARAQAGAVATAVQSSVTLQAMIAEAASRGHLARIRVSPSPNAGGAL